MTPREAYERLVAGEVELVPADKLAEAHRGERGDALPAGHPDADVGRELRQRRIRRRSSTCAACRTARSSSPDSPA